MDEWVAEVIFEDPRPLPGDAGILVPYNARLPDYSTDIAAAWTIVDKLKDRYTDIDYEGDGGDWRVFFSDDTFGLSQHVEVAICRAALKASES